MENQAQQNSPPYEFSENKTNLIALGIALGLVALGFFFFTKMNSKQEKISDYTSPTSAATITSGSAPTPQTSVAAKKQIMDNGLEIQDLVVGTGAEATVGKKITVNYTGTLTDGTKFDSSKDHGTPFSFTLGAGQVIQGWDQGFAGMKIGGKRKLTIPASLGYGDSGVPGAIPPGATLIFEVELLKVE